MMSPRFGTGPASEIGRSASRTEAMRVERLVTVAAFHRVGGICPSAFIERRSGTCSATQPETREACHTAAR
jgi:hypothetical protein